MSMLLPNCTHLLHLPQVGLPATINTTSAERTFCGQQRECARCESTPGCSFCGGDGTGMCVAAAPSSSGSSNPVIGSCPKGSNLMTEAAQCLDCCKTRSNSCTRCLHTTGCGWNAQTCECVSEFMWNTGLAGDSTSGDKFFTKLAQRDTCSASVVGDSCSGERIVSIQVCCWHCLLLRL